MYLRNIQISNERFFERYANQRELSTSGKQRSSHSGNKAKFDGIYLDMVFFGVQFGLVVLGNYDTRNKLFLLFSIYFLSLLFVEAAKEWMTERKETGIVYT